MHHGIGGRNAFIIRDDAELDHAVTLAVRGRLSNTGQACAGSKRFIVHDAMFDPFTRHFAAAMDGLVAGDPLDERSTLGPLVNEAAVKGILDQIDRAVVSGARVVRGGQRLDRLGCFVDVTILMCDRTTPSPRRSCSRQSRWSSAARRRRSDPPSRRHALRPGREHYHPRHRAGAQYRRTVDAGMVFINSNVLSAPELPFGGVKYSGFGRELSDLGIGEFVNRNLVTLN